jgi:hypothetical protein
VCAVPKVLVAGDCLQWLRHKRKIHRCDSSAVDLFMVGPSSLAVQSVVYQIGLLYVQYFGDYYCMRTASTVTFFRLQSRHRNVVHLVLVRYPDLGRLFSSFEIDAACFSFDYNGMTCNQRGLCSWECGVNVVAVPVRSRAYADRLLEYHFDYGFGVSDPGYIPSRVVETYHPRFGLAQLLQSPHWTRPSNLVWGAKNIHCLVHRVQLLLDQSAQFVLRYQNCEVWDLPIPSYGPQIQLQNRWWYAQAYGGMLLPSWRKVMTSCQAKITNSKPGSQAWQLDLGCYRLTRLGLVEFP